MYEGFLLLILVYVVRDIGCHHYGMCSDMDTTFDKGFAYLIFSLVDPHVDCKILVVLCRVQSVKSLL